jgi:MFS family permease
LWISFSLPAFILGPIASATVDILDLRKVLFVTNLLQGLVIAFFGLTSESGFFLVYFIVFLYSLLNQFYVPAEYATLPRVVETKLLAQANGLFLTTQQGALILGFGLAGLILSSLGLKNTLYLCSFFLLAAAFSVYFLPKMKNKDILPSSWQEILPRFIRSIGEGYKFIKENRFILAPFLLMVSMQVALTITLVNAPSFSAEIVKIPLAFAGIYLVVPAGIGAFLATLVIPRWLSQGVRKVKLIKTCLLVLAFSLLIITYVFFLM